MKDNEEEEATLRRLQREKENMELNTKLASESVKTAQDKPKPAQNHEPASETKHSSSQSAESLSSVTTVVSCTDAEEVCSLMMCCTVKGPA